MDARLGKNKTILKKVIWLIIIGPLASLCSATEGVMNITSSGVIRTLTENHTGTIIISGNYVVLDCNNHTVSFANQPAVCERNGSPRQCGIEVRGSIVDVRNCTISGHQIGISLAPGSNGVWAYDNRIYSNNEGIYSNYSYDPQLFDNVIAFNDQGVSIRNNIGMNFHHNNVAYSSGDGVDVNDSNFTYLEYNSLVANADHNIEVDDSMNVTVVGNLFLGRQSFFGFTSQTVRDNLQLDNVSTINVYNNFSENAGRHGIYIRNVTGGTVSGNESSGSRGVDCWNRFSSGISYFNNSFDVSAGCD